MCGVLARPLVHGEDGQPFPAWTRARLGAPEASEAWCGFREVRPGCGGRRVRKTGSRCVVNTLLPALVNGGPPSTGCRGGGTGQTGLGHVPRGAECSLSPPSDGWPSGFLLGLRRPTRTPSPHLQTPHQHGSTGSPVSGPAGASRLSRAHAAPFGGQVEQSRPVWVMQARPAQPSWGAGLRLEFRPHPPTWSLEPAQLPAVQPDGARSAHWCREPLFSVPLPFPEHLGGHSRVGGDAFAAGSGIGLHRSQQPASAVTGHHRLGPCYPPIRLRVLL